MISLIERRQQILDGEIEQLLGEAMNEDRGFKGEKGKAPDVMFRAHVSAMIPKEEDVGKDGALNPQIAARYENYEVKMESLLDISPRSPKAGLSPRKKEADVDFDGDFEMGGMGGDSPGSEIRVPRTREELRQEMMDLVEEGLRELEVYDGDSQQELDKLKGWLKKKKQGSISTSENAVPDVPELRRLSLGMPGPGAASRVFREKISFEQLASKG